MSTYIPNIGEQEALKAILLQQAMVIGLYKNSVIPDGNTIFATLEEMPTGGGRGYAPKSLSNDLIVGSAVADKWAMSVNSSGKAEAVYDNATQDWTFQTADVADVNTVYGVFGYTLVLPFDAGAKEIKVGDTVKGATSAATGVVTGINITSGSWAAGTAAGNLYIKNQTGTFQDGENLYVAGEIATLVAAPTAAGDTYSIGDLFKIDDATLAGEGAVGVVLTLTGADNSPVATIGTVPGCGGRNYTVAAGQDTQKITGGGNDALTVEVATLATAAYAVTNTGATADSHKKLLFVEALTTPIAITTLGQIISYTPKLTMSTL
jgi:hypothetical protein